MQERLRVGRKPSPTTPWDYTFWKSLLAQQLKQGHITYTRKRKNCKIFIFSDLNWKASTMRQNLRRYHNFEIRKPCFPQLSSKSRISRKWIVMECRGLVTPNSEICLDKLSGRDLNDVSYFSRNGRIVCNPYQNARVPTVFWKRRKHETTDEYIRGEVTWRRWINLRTLEGKVKISGNWAHRLGGRQVLGFSLNLDNCCQSLHISLETITQLGINKLAKDGLAMPYGVRTPCLQQYRTKICGSCVTTSNWFFEFSFGITLASLTRDFTNNQ